RRQCMLSETLGRLDEAIGHYRRVLDLDPLSAVTVSNTALALYAAGLHAEAAAMHRKALELAPQRAMSHAVLGLTLLAMGRRAEALAEVEAEPEQTWRLWALGIVQHAIGRTAAADETLREFISRYAEGGAYQVAEVYAERREIDDAFVWLEKAYDQR